MCDALIRRLQESYICQRHLESPNLSQNDAFSQAWALEQAQQQSSVSCSSDPEFYFNKGAVSPLGHTMVGMGSGDPEVIAGPPCFQGS